MATLTKVGAPSLSSLNPNQDQIITGITGEAIAAGDLCYIASTGLIMRSNGTAATAPAKCRGIAANAAPSGGPLTVYNDVRFEYGAGLTPGTNLFVSATAGAVDDAATTGGTAAVGYVVSATRIHIFGSRY